MLKVSKEQYQALNTEIIDAFWRRTSIELQAEHPETSKDQITAIVAKCRKDCRQYDIETENGMFSYTSVSVAIGEVLSAHADFQSALDRAPKEMKSPEDVAVIAYELMLYLEGRL